MEITKESAVSQAFSRCYCQPKTERRGQGGIVYRTWKKRQEARSQLIKSFRKKDREINVGLSSPSSFFSPILFSCW